MAKITIKNIIKKYSQRLQEAKYPFSAIYLFGSHAQNKAHKWSDIDVAIISSRLKRNYEENRFKLWDLRLGLDTRIEPHGFTPEDFKDECDPMVCEIKKTGIRIV